MKLRTLALGLLLAAIAAPANATLYKWTYTDSNGVVDASGKLTAGPISGSAAEVTSMVGSVFGVVPNQGTITGFTPNPGMGAVYSPSGMFIYDNVIYPAGNPTLDTYGLLFSIGGIEYNIWGNSPANYSFYEWNPDAGAYVFADNGGHFTLKALPEPSALALLLSGVIAMFGAGLMVRRRNAH